MSEPMLDNVLSTVIILGWIVFVLFLLLVGLRGFQMGGARGAFQAVTRPRVLIVLVLILALSLVSASLVFIEPQEVGVVVSLVSRDGYRDQPMRSGLHWIVPLAERVANYPIYWQTYTMSSDALEGDKVGDDSIAARTSDGQAVFLDASVIFRIDGNEAIRVHIDLQDRYIEDFIRPLMRGVLRSEVSQFTVDEVNSSKRTILESNLQEQLELSFREKGFILDRFLLRNIGFSPEYAAAVENKQVAEQTRLEREFQAQQIRNLAEGERDKLRIEAEGAA
ncbi:MAG: prohibitin family protein, partial [Anaerolineales bacterium]|nr:prohibitin family protein [Anaerolineales bacterium]